MSSTSASASNNAKTITHAGVTYQFDPVIDDAVLIWATATTKSGELRKYKVDSVFAKGTRGSIFSDDPQHWNVKFSQRSAAAYTLLACSRILANYNLKDAEETEGYVADVLASIRKLYPSILVLPGSSVSPAPIAVSKDHEILTLTWAKCDIEYTIGWKARHNRTLPVGKSRNEVEGHLAALERAKFHMISWDEDEDEDEDD